MSVRKVMYIYSAGSHFFVRNNPPPLPPSPPKKKTFAEITHVHKLRKSLDLTTLKKFYALCLKYIYRKEFVFMVERCRTGNQAPSQP